MRSRLRCWCSFPPFETHAFGNAPRGEDCTACWRCSRRCSRSPPAKPRRRPGRAAQAGTRQSAKNLLLAQRRPADQDRAPRRSASAFATLSAVHQPRARGYRPTLRCAIGRMLGKPMSTFVRMSAYATSSLQAGRATASISPSPPWATTPARRSGALHLALTFNTVSETTKSSVRASFP